MENKETKTSRCGRPPRSQEQITASRNVIIQAAKDLFAACYDISAQQNALHPPKATSLAVDDALHD